MQRRPKRNLHQESDRYESKLLSENDIGLKLKIKKIDGKGRGVFADSDFEKNDFIVEYAGDLIDLKEAKLREAKYVSDQMPGGYLYHFRSRDMPFCIDATEETGRLGTTLEIICNEYHFFLQVLNI